MDYDILISRLLSPIELGICFLIIFYANGKAWSVLLAAAMATLASVWSPGSDVENRSFWYTLLACTIQSVVIYCLILLKNKLIKD